MKRINSSQVFMSILLISVLSLILVSCGDDDIDAANISEALANRLTDALKFEGSEVVGEMPPPAGKKAEEAQISKLDAPKTIKLGEPFKISLTTSWAKPEEINMAVIWVKGSTKHIWVTRDIYPEGASFNADIGSVLANDPELAGKTYTVAISLQLHNDTSGDYVDWEFSVEK